MSELTAFNAYCRANGINANGQLATEDLEPAFSAGYKARQDTFRKRVAELEKQRDELLAAAEAIEIDAEECLDFDEFTAMLVPIDTYHKLMEAIASINEK